MSLEYGFFNSVGGDRKYNADDMSSYYQGLISDGVVNHYQDSMQVISGEGMNVIVSKGRAYIGGKYAEVTAPETLAIEQSSTTLNRIDAVVLRKDMEAREITVSIKKGVEAQTPSAPVMERTSTITEFCLAYVAVNKLMEAVTQAEITDTRADSRLCGWVTGLIDFLDTSQLYDQWSTAYNKFYADSTKEYTDWSTQKKEVFDEWFNSLVTELGVTTVNEDHQAEVSVTAETTNLDIPAEASYTDGDILQVFKNGMLLTKGRDYTISGNTVTFQSAVPAGNTIMFYVIKSVIKRV